MPNNEATEEQLRIRMLCSMGLAAIELNDLETYKLAVRQLNASSLDDSLPAAIRNVAAQCHTQLGEELLKSGIDDMTGIVDELRGATDELRKALDMAKTGQKKLSLPAAAKAATDFQASINELAKGQSDDVKKLLQKVVDGLKGVLPGLA
jgi:hypothetical protein